MIIQGEKELRLSDGVWINKYGLNNVEAIFFEQSTITSGSDCTTNGELRVDGAYLFLCASNSWRLVGY